MRNITAFLLTGLLISILLAAAPADAEAGSMTDFVFIIDGTSSMAQEVAAVRGGLNGFINGLDLNNVDARFSVILFGGAPELVLDFTSSKTGVMNTFTNMAVGAGVTNLHNDHSLDPEAGLEAIRIALGAAVDNTLLRNNVGGTGGLVYRPGARKNIILITDEDSDLPYYSANRMPGQTGNAPPLSLTTEWQDEVDATAAAVIANQAFVNLLINLGDTPSQSQYGDPRRDVADSDLTNFDAAATLAALSNRGLGMSLQAQVLRSGLIGRSFSIANVGDQVFIDNFFKAKIEESIVVPLPAGVWMGMVLLGSIGIVRRIRRRRR